MEKLGADSCGKLLPCHPLAPRFIPVSGPPPPGQAAAERGLAPQDGSDRIGLGSLDPWISMVGPPSRSSPGSWMDAGFKNR
ncbi:MAG: hypothetical protein OXC26_01185, partial [Albidovulum sp.]|nr:hypothetical protein [Albidovulum sp.]